MWRWSLVILGAGLGVWLVSARSEGRGRGGGGGGFGGGGGAAVGHFAGGGAVPQRTASPIVGASGGSLHGGSKSGSYTTQGGSTIQYGKGVGGVQVTTPGGTTATKVGSAQGAVGPRGNAVAGKSSVGAATGPGGNRVVAGSKSASAIGPQGVIHAGAKGAVANGPYGAAAGFSRYAVGAGGAVGHRTAVWTGGQLQ